MDDEIRQLLAAGDATAACRVAHETYAAEVRRFVGKRRPTATDDVCQEIWAAVGRAIGKFRFEASMRSWILMIARRKLVDAWRDDDPAIALEDSLVEEPMLSKPSPRSELVREERRAALRAALVTMPADDRELLELRYVVGLKPQEIAESLGVPSNTVSQRLVRALRRLKTSLPSELFAP